MFRVCFQSNNFQQLYEPDLNCDDPYLRSKQQQLIWRLVVRRNVVGRTCRVGLEVVQPTILYFQCTVLALVPVIQLVSCRAMMSRGYSLSRSVAASCLTSFNILNSTIGSDSETE